MTLSRGLYRPFAQAHRLWPNAVHNLGHQKHNMMNLGIDSTARVLSLHGAVSTKPICVRTFFSDVMQRFRVADQEEPTAKVPKQGCEDTHYQATFVLIGSTGCSKSALGNFLLDPSEDHLYKACTLKVGQTGASETKGVQFKERNGVKVIDTAGLNESHSKDWANMVNCVRDLRSVGHINVVVLVMKFENRMDQSWKDTVKYYNKLMGEAFSKNLVIVLNAYKPGAKKYMASGGPPLKQNIEMASKEVQKLLGLPVPPLAFAVDSYLDEENHVEQHLQERVEILRYAAQQQPVSLARLMVPKTAAIIHADELEIARLKQKKLQVTKDHQKALSVPSTAKEEMAMYAKSEEQFHQMVAGMQKRLQQIDTKEEIELAGQRVVIDSSFGISRKSFSISTSTPIQKSDTWSSRGSRVVVERSTPQQLSGYVQRGGLDAVIEGYRAEIKVYSWSKDVHADEIIALKKELAVLEGKRLKNMERRRQLQKDFPAIEAAVQELANELKNLEDAIQDLERTHLTVEEAESREVPSAPHAKS